MGALIIGARRLPRSLGRVANALCLEALRGHWPRRATRIACACFALGLRGCGRQFGTGNLRRGPITEAWARRGRCLPLAALTGASDAQEMEPGEANAILRASNAGRGGALAGGAAGLSRRGRKGVGIASRQGVDIAGRMAGWGHGIGVRRVSGRLGERRAPPSAWRLCAGGDRRRGDGACRAAAGDTGRVGARPHHKPQPVCTTNQNQDNPARCLNCGARSERGGRPRCFLVIELLASA